MSIFCLLLKTIFFFFEFTNTNTLRMNAMQYYIIDSIIQSPEYRHDNQGQAVHESLLGQVDADDYDDDNLVLTRTRSA